MKNNSPSKIKIHEKFIASLHNFFVFSDTAAKLDEFLSGQAAHYNFNGNVLVAENGKIVFKKSYGFADFDTKRLLNDSSVFELASVSKQFTATGILLLKDKGKLKLTDSLRQYFPELPYSNITIWHMLTHTSGLPDYEEAMNEKWDRSKIAFNNDMIAFLAKEKLPVLFAPGTKWTYSNTAYAILASIIEKISGQSFKDYMADNIFQPLGMHHTRVYNTRRSLKDTIANYAYNLAKDFHRFYHDVRILNAETEAAIAFRCELSDQVGKVLFSAFDLLGIEMPDRM